jgi:hypothetical protein
VRSSGRVLLAPAGANSAGDHQLDCRWGCCGWQRGAGGFKIQQFHWPNGHCDGVVILLEPVGVLGLPAGSWLQRQSPNARCSAASQAWDGKPRHRQGRNRFFFGIVARIRVKRSCGLRVSCFVMIALPASFQAPQPPA